MEVTCVMIYFNSCSVALDYKECPRDIQFIDFDLKNKYKNTNYALKIDFKNDLNYSIKCIKKLIQFENSNIVFSTNYNNLNVKYIIINYNDDVLDALKSIFISDLKQKYSFIYDCIFNSLDKIWRNENPCKFCNDVCIASKNHSTAHEKDGCCYSFEYSKNPFSLSFIKNVKPCKYLNENKSCTTKNLSCKFFVCNYLKKNNLFNLKMEDFLLINTFFSKKQKLILINNFFKSK